MTMRVAIVGGGISGLAAAERLHALEPAAEVHLLESSGRIGGVLDTRREDGFLLESAADNFLVNPPAAVDLCSRLGMGDVLIKPRGEHRQAFVVHRSRLQSIPAGFTVMAPSRLRPVLASPVLSVRGKLRMGLECLLPPRADDGDESLAQFVRRRFGREVLERLVQPLVGGIYSADPERLSVDAAMPRFRQMEREHGSLIRALLAQRKRRDADRSSGARYGQFATLAGGMASLVAAIAEQAPPGAIQLHSPVDRLAAGKHGRWLLSIGGARPRRLEVDGVILATPAYRAAHMVAELDALLAEELADIEYASCAIASLGYRRQQIKHPLDGFGFVVPLVEQRTILSCSFTSQKYAGRAPDDSTLLRVFIGGACQSGLLRLSSNQLVELAKREVSALLGIDGQPCMTHLVRHHRAMPQYHVGHLDRLGRIEGRVARFDTLALAGSAYGAVGVPGCIDSGRRCADRLHARLSRGPALRLVGVSKNKKMARH